MTNIETRAVDYVRDVLRTAGDWQEAQHALADHDEFGPWIVAACGGDEMAQIVMCQTLISRSEGAER